jgi:putative N6-adenine-specific DNA methylase
MATFRSRQRASQRRDGTRETHATQQDAQRQPAAPAADTQRKTPHTQTPAEKSPTDHAAGQHKPKPQADAPRRRLISPASETAAQDAATPHKPHESAAPEPAPAAAAPRRRLISPASEAPPLDKAAAHHHDDATKPAQAPAAPRRRLISPVNDAPEQETGTPPQRRADTAPKSAPSALRQPNRHAPEQRRGLPATESMPTERPAFERRTAEPRRRPGAPAHMALFASCPRGLEPVLQQELRRLGADEIAPVDGGIGFAGSMELLMRVNLESRVASRVLLRLARGAYRSEREINALAMQVDWPRYFDVARTIKVKTDGIGARVKSLDYVSLTVKDAVCDRFRQAQQGRPSVDTRSPDVRIQVFLGAEEASIYLDSSGEALFKRGWREESGEAPLRENLAAGILLLAGYKGDEPLLDPMCGSATFLVEAADIALNRAPGRARAFAFEKWQIFDQPLWTRLCNNARAAEKPAAPLPIRGSDRDARMVAIARANLERAGLAGLISVEQGELFDSRPHASHGLIVTNPPYGVRLEEQDTLAELYPPLGDWLKQHFAGWTANLFTGDLRLPKLIRLTIKRRIPLYNGALECRLFVLPLIAGSARAAKPQA